MDYLILTEPFGDPMFVLSTRRMKTEESRVYLEERCGLSETEAREYVKRLPVCVEVDGAIERSQVGTVADLSKREMWWRSVCGA